LAEEAENERVEHDLDALEPPALAPLQVADRWRVAERLEQRPQRPVVVDAELDLAPRLDPAPERGRPLVSQPGARAAVERPHPQRPAAGGHRAGRIVVE